MSGRKNKIVEINKKHLTKSEKVTKQNAEKKASEGLSNLQITPPEHLGKEAKKEYRRIIKDLQNLPLKNIDRGVLDIYCSWYAVYRTADKELQANGIFTDKGRANPAVNILDKASARLIQAANNLGLTVDSRMKIVSPTVNDQPDDPFAKYNKQREM